MALVFVLPKAIDEEISIESTPSSEFNVKETIVGKIMNVNMKPAVITLYDVGKWKMVLTTGPSDSAANKPKITEGILANISIVTLELFWYRLAKRYLMNSATLIPIGAAMIMARMEIIKVIVSGNHTEAFLSLKSNVEPKIDQPYALNPLTDEMVINIIKVKKTNENNHDKTVETVLDIRSATFFFDTNLESNLLRIEFCSKNCISVVSCS